MRILSLCSIGISVAVIAILFAAAKPASADTYQIYKLDGDQGRFFYGMDDSGTVVLDNLSGNYETFVTGSGTGFSVGAPTLAADNGNPCTPVVPSGGVVLHESATVAAKHLPGKLTSGQFSPAIYTGTDPVADYLAGGGGGFIFMDGSGDIVFDDTFSENWFEAIDATTAVPEPCSLLLFGTGVIAAIGTMRRRLVQ